MTRVTLRSPEFLLVSVGLFIFSRALPWERLTQIVGQKFLTLGGYNAFLTVTDVS